jgi:hypothetical protein
MARVDMLEQVGPDRLRAGIATPGAPHSGGQQEQADTRHDQQTRHEIEFVRPDLDANM